MKLKAEDQVRYNDTSSSAFSFSTVKDTILFSNVHIGLITAAVSLIIPLLNGLPISPNCHLFIFFSTVFIYNFDHRRISTGDRTNSPERCHWINKNRKRLVEIVNKINAVANPDGKGRDDL